MNRFNARFPSGKRRSEGPGWSEDRSGPFVSVIMGGMAKLIIANWKLHPLSEREAVRLAKASDKKNVVVCPPFPFVAGVGKVLKRAALGAQDLFWEEEGPHTGEVS